LVKNANQHDITHGGTTAAIVWTANDQFNLKENFGFSQGPHTNGVQTVGGTGGGIFQYETTYSPQPHSPLSSDGATTGATAELQNKNQLLVTGGMVPSGGAANSLAVGMHVVSNCISGLDAITKVSSNATATPILTLASNYTRETGALCVFDIVDAYPFGVLMPYRIVTQAFADATLNKTVISHNTIISSGPIAVVTYSIVCGTGAPAAANSNRNARIENNYIDYTAAFGPFYKGRHCSPNDPANYGTMSTSGNINMKTGSALMYLP
jgi:hypothetical protein